MAAPGRRSDGGGSRPRWDENLAYNMRRSANWVASNPQQLKHGRPKDAESRMRIAEKNGPEAEGPRGEMGSRS